MSDYLRATGMCLDDPEFRYSGVQRRLYQCRVKVVMPRLFLGRHAGVLTVHPALGLSNASLHNIYIGSFLFTIKTDHRLRISSGLSNRQIGTEILHKYFIQANPN